jgi:hypothetical protein
VTLNKDTKRSNAVSIRKALCVERWCGPIRKSVAPPGDSFLLEKLLTRQPHSYLILFNPFLYFRFNQQELLITSYNRFITPFFSIPLYRAYSLIMKTQTALLAVSALISSVLATPVLEARATSVTNAKTPVVTTKGNAFFDSTGARFYIRGVDYQPGSFVPTLLSFVVHF